MFGRPPTYCVTAISDVYPRGVRIVNPRSWTTAGVKRFKWLKNNAVDGGEDAGLAHKTRH